MDLWKGSTEAAPFSLSHRVIAGAGLALLLPFCWMLAASNNRVASPDLPSILAEFTVVFNCRNIPSVAVEVISTSRRAVRSLSRSPHELVVRRHERSQVSNRVRRAKKASPALQPLLCDNFSAAPRVADQATTASLTVHHGRSPPVA